MPYHQKNTVSSPGTLDFQDKATKEKFDKWMINTKLLQVRFITALTGLLYILYAFINSLVVTSEILPLMLTIHLYIMPSLLFLISLMTFKKDLYKLYTFLLILAPVAAAAGNLLIVSKLEDPALYMTEIYLILFWIFIVSGLRLWQEILSALITFILVIAVTYFFFSLSTEYFIMHCFWMLASLSFGFLSAYLLERSYKEVFCTHEQLTQIATTDKLTGLHNRAKLDELLQNALDRSKRFHHSFGLVIMDIDHFKEINDTYGHLAGDTVLRELSKLITERLRPTDKVIRWGGEEFLLICAETDQKNVLERVKKLCLKIQQHHFSIPSGITASFGLTHYSKGDTIDSIIKRADDALYLAKNSGRNRIEFL
jgi:diguanylate cyclase (GGDEF)-like protein